MNERHDDKGNVIVPRWICYVFLFSLVHLMYKDYRRTQEYDVALDMVCKKLDQFEESVTRISDLMDRLDDPKREK